MHIRAQPEVTQCRLHFFAIDSQKYIACMHIPVQNMAQVDVQERLGELASDTVCNVLWNNSDTFVVLTEAAMMPLSHDR
jgi:hypothetical protein